MKVKVIGSSSSGNGYVFTSSDGESVVLECGRPLSLVKKALDYKVAGVRGIFVTHEHGDHAGRVKEYLNDLNAPMFMSKGTWEAIEEKTKARRVPNIVKDRELISCGRFGVMPILLKSENGNLTHDAAEPMAYLLMHEEMGITIFATDTYCVPFSVMHPNHIMLECNYELDILNSRFEAGQVDEKRRNRTIESHMSLANCIKELQAMELKYCQSITLLHLSNDNSNEEKFVDQVRKEVGFKGKVRAAKDGDLFGMNRY